MQYFTNQDLANNHHVSVRTVRNWIESAKSGKLDLALHSKGERTFIANTSKNLAAIQKLAQKGKKYRPHRSQKTVTPKPEFYKLYTQDQLYDIVSNLEIHREIDRKYNYFEQGAATWDEYVKRMSLEESPNMLKATIELLETNGDYIDNLLAQYSQINVIDLGVGNALPAQAFLSHLLEQGKLGRYIAIDISPSMLQIAEKNIQKRFGGKVAFESHALDLDYNRFGNLLAEEYIKTNAEHTTNVILFLGGTIQNFKKPGSIFAVIHDSMGVNDFLIHDQKLDTQSSRRYFDFSPSPSNTTLAPNHRLIFDLLNIDESWYEVDMGFDPILSERYIRVVLKLTLSIRFSFNGGERVIHFDKGDMIQLFRARQCDVVQVVRQLTESDLYPLQVSQTDDQEFVLTVSRIKRDSHVS